MTTIEPPKKDGTSVLETPAWKFLEDPPGKARLCPSQLEIPKKNLMRMRNQKNMPVSLYKELEILEGPKGNPFNSQVAVISHDFV